MFHDLFDESRLHLTILEKLALGEIVAFNLEDWSRQREDALASEIGEDGGI
jgi:ABC-type thiamine transport system ATPase subunit